MKNILSSSVKNCVGILLNLEIAFGREASHFYDTSSIDYEHGGPFHLLRMSSMSVFDVLTFFYRVRLLTCLV